MSLFSFKPISLGGFLGKVTYIVNNVETSSGAFDLHSECFGKIYVPTAIGAVCVQVLIYNEGEDECIYREIAEWTSLIEGYDVYTFSIPTKKISTGLYFYEIQITCAYGVIYSTLCYDDLIFDYKPFNKKIQFSLSNFKYPLPKKFLGGIIYHIFVDRFRKGGDVPIKDGAILIDNWDDGIPEYPEYPGAYIKNNTFFGGTLYGVKDKLYYLKSLGVNILYLSPIFQSPSNHKYDTSDYMRVDEMFGGDEGLSELIEAAEAEGIGIILDGVFNHTGADSIYFNKYSTYNNLGAYQSKESPFYSWFNFYDYPTKYECWWNIDILPRINTENCDCSSYFLGHRGVIDKYASLGILGFRLDVADELSDEFIRGIKERLSSKIRAPLLYGEVWEDGSNKIAYGRRKSYYLGDELDGVMNYPLRRGILSYLRDSETDALRYALTEIINNAPHRIRHFQMNILGTHDTERVLTVLGGVDLDISNTEKRATRLSNEERAIAVKLLKMAYTILMTLPGIPAIYYGDEVGLEGYSDPFNRMPFPWGMEDKEILDFVRLLSDIRRKHNVYKLGDFKLYELNSTRLIYSRKSKTNAYITIVNNSDCSLVFSANYNFFSYITRKRCIKGKKYVVNPYSSEIIKIPNDALFTLFD